MDFSDKWRSLWPIGAVPHAPNLLTDKETASFGPLLFRPSLSRVILSSTSLDLRIPPAVPPSALTDIQSVFSCPSFGFGLSKAEQYDLAADIVTSLTSSGVLADSLSSNNLHALPCRDGSSLLLFFPTGDNADEIGFLSLCFNGENLKPDVGVGSDGDIFKQRDGMKYPHHRILKMSVIPAEANYSSQTSEFITEGFLLATTLYSVNWFRVETRASDNGTAKHLLVPLANQGFSRCVVDACWSPHFSEESAVLLESGELSRFNLINKKFDTIRVSPGSNGDPEGWLGCKFGGQPWVILVASSTAIVLIDLRPKRINEKPKVLARLKFPDFLGVVSAKGEKDTFRAFCRAEYNNFHFSVVTETLLLLFDLREPFVPVLTWVHGLELPTHVSMFKLSELRPSEEFKLASESGFVILVGSFLKNEFKLFCYGSSDRGAFGSSLYAWELPSSLSLSNKQWRSADELVRKMILKEKLPNQEMLLRKEGVIGFFIVPKSLLKSRPEPSGFVLIRLMLSGKLEIQEYHSSHDSLSDQTISEGEDKQEAEDLTIYNVHEGGDTSSRFLFFKLSCLHTYMRGNISIMLTNLYSELNGKAKVNKPFCDDMRELMSSKFQSPSISFSSFLFDVSSPTNVFEVASRRLLTTLKPNILSMAFTKYGELFTSPEETSFLPLEFPNCLPHHQLTPFFVYIPSSRSENLSSKLLTPEAIVGPVLPLPVLLILQQMGLNKTKLSSKEELNDDLLNLECKGVLENLFPVISNADNGGFSGCGTSQEPIDDIKYLVYQPTLRSCTSIFKHTRSPTSLNKEVQTQMNNLSDNSLFDDKFMNFILGISDKNCKADHGPQVKNSENFEFSPLKLDFEPLNIMLQPTEQKNLESLKRQASNWLEKNKSYQDFSTSSKIQKSI